MIDDLKKSVLGACCTASVMLEDGELKALCGSGYGEETMWLLGTGSRKVFEGLEARPPGDFHSINRDTGIFCFRSGMTAGAPFVLIDCGPHGWKGCGHAHADLLSFIWYSGGEMVLTDPGTFTYTGSRDIRDRSRSSQSHNTVSLNGRSQSVPGEPFRWKSVAAPVYARAHTKGDSGYFTGGHDAWDGLGCRHGRTLVYFGADLAVVIDELSVSRTLDSVLFNLQFGEGNLDGRGNGIFEFEGNRTGSTAYLRLIAGEDAAVDIRDGEFYPDYGTRVAAPRLELTAGPVVEDMMIVTLLSPDEELAGSFRLEYGSGHDGSGHDGWKLEGPGFSIERRGGKTIVLRDGEEVFS
jgi:hypothetical protein